MGYGQYSYNSRGDSSVPGVKRYSNSQVAHVWNAQTEERGQSNNGNFYFAGPALYSYGTHFLAGYIMPDGVAFLNGDSYSVTTSGHMSDARSATSNRATFTVRELTELRDLLSAISRGKLTADDKRRARDDIRKHAEALTAARLFQPGESSWDYAEEPDPETGSRYREKDMSHAMTAGEYLTRAAGLPAASWPKLAREAAAIKAKREAQTAKDTAGRATRLAIALADMPDAEFRRRLSVVDPEHVHSTYRGQAEQRLGTLAKDLFRSIRVANAEGFSKRRRARLSARHKLARARLADANRLESIVFARSDLRAEIRAVRSLAADWKARVETGELPDYHTLRTLERGADILDKLSGKAAFPVATRERLAFEARRVRAAAERLETERRDREEAERKAEREARELETAEHRAKWLAGEAPLAGRRFDAPSGGAALRINGNRLETSHGAEVPLEQAIRAFRFIKLCRERETGWRANGQRIRVGAFHVDWIDAEGNMQAGCHSFTWPEIERAAALAGVANATANAEAVQLKESA